MHIGEYIKNIFGTSKEEDTTEVSNNDYIERIKENQNNYMKNQNEMNDLLNLDDVPIIATIICDLYNYAHPNLSKSSGMYGPAGTSGHQEEILQFLETHNTIIRCFIEDEYIGGVGVKSTFIENVSVLTFYYSLFTFIFDNFDSPKDFCCIVSNDSMMKLYENVISKIDSASKLKDTNTELYKHESSHTIRSYVDVSAITDDTITGDGSPYGVLKYSLKEFNNA